MSVPTNWKIPLTDLAIFSKNELEKLHKLGLFSLLDLLLYLPLRYEDKSHLTPMQDLRIGDKVLLEGTISAANYTNRNRNFMVRLEDATSFVYLRFINYYQSLIIKLIPGRVLRAYGEIRQGYLGLEIVHPELTLQETSDKSLKPLDENLTPIYSTTASIKQFFIRNCVKKALNYCQNLAEFPEVLPYELIAEFNLPSIMQALHRVHFPDLEDSKSQLIAFRTKAQIRLIFEELLARQLSLLAKRQILNSHTSAKLPLDANIHAKFLAKLAFTPTQAQIRVFEQIQADLTQNQPMLRLLQGDVGSGKTLVAAFAILQTMQAGYQAVLMSPTEILATQHFASFKNWFADFGFKVVFLAGKQTAKQKKQILQAIATGACDLIIGTQAVIQKNVVFKNLALSVIDEQHRFGVKQREELFINISNQEAIFPHQLIMTATPIPRTLAMSLYADLEISIIDEMPANRQTIQTYVMPMNKRQDLIKRLTAAKAKGMQIFWVCALVLESETLNCKAAEDTYADLLEELPNFKIGLVHGKQKSIEKDANMQAFRNGELDLLVSTSVIEVGVDVPSAGVMIIDNAERFGLAQLHQLRGRIGRGNKEAFCILLYQSPLSQISASRLAVIRNSLDGFAIAQADLKLRGEGDTLGKLQAGRANLRIVDIRRDLEYFTKLQKLAPKMLNSQTANALIDRWQTEILLS